MILLFGGDAECEKFSRRFWSKVDKSGGPDACWMWKAGALSSGYGALRVNCKSDTAHRTSYVLANGWIPPGMFVCHRCDVPACVNPAHLFLGDVETNNRDMWGKGRGRVPMGVNHRLAKLNPDVAKDIRRRAANGEGHRALGREYGVDHKTIGGVVHGRTWTPIQSEPSQ